MKKFCADVFVGYEDGTISKHPFVLEAESEDKIDLDDVKNFCDYAFYTGEVSKIVVGNELTDDEADEILEDDVIRERYTEMYG